VNLIGMSRNIIRSLLALLSLALASLPALAQEKQPKNEATFSIGATLTTSQGLSPGANLIGSGGTVLPNRSIEFDSSLALGAEYDRGFVLKKRVALYGGVDFLASPNDVKLSQVTQNVPRSYAYIFLTPHVRLKFHPAGSFSPWLSFGGGYARFLSSVPPAAIAFQRGTNTGTFVFGGGVDTRTPVHLFKIPIGFRIEVRDFYSGLPNYNVKVAGSKQNNLSFTGGPFIRF
jgi:hypothetical protein